ncbi:MAG: hypothetical protein DRG37_03855 [Deltaproteobacteria bacterium]|nr:MAG: hypothetical protein DRG37_03855 [Deltaproteobacteria bacterium]
MRSELIANRYAKALFDLAREEGKEEKFLEELRSVVKIVAENEELKSMLESPLYDLFLKKKILAGITSKMGLSQYMCRFLDILLEKDRFSYLEDIQKAYIEIMDEVSGKVRAKIITAIEIDDKDVEEISDALSKVIKKKISPEVSVDPSLIGGIVAEVQGMVYDGSIKRQLEKIKQSIKR